MRDRRGQDQFARHRRADERRHFQSLRGDFGADRRWRQQRIAEPLLHQADLGAIGIGLDQGRELQPLARRRLLQQRAQAVRDARQDQLLLHQPFEIDLLSLAQPRSRRPHHGDILAADGLDRKMQVDGRAVDDGEIHFGPVQPLDQMPAIALHDAQRDVRKLVEDAARKSSGQHGAHRRHHPEDDAPRGAAVGRFEIVADLLDLADQAGGPVEQHPAGAGQQHATPVADEQLDAELMFEQLDVPAQRRLGRAQPVSRLAQASEFRYGPESPQLFEIHRVPRAPTMEAIICRFRILRP